MFDLELYESVKEGLNITVCDECKGEFILTKDSIQEDSLIAKGEQILLTYFTCPHCGKVYKIKVDTLRSLQMLEVYRMQAKLIADKKKRGKEVTQANLNRLAKAKKILDKEYASLDKTFKGSFYQK